MQERISEALHIVYKVRHIVQRQQYRRQRVCSATWYNARAFQHQLVKLFKATKIEKNAQQPQHQSISYHLIPISSHLSFCWTIPLKCTFTRYIHHSPNLCHCILHYDFTLLYHVLIFNCSLLHMSLSRTALNEKFTSRGGG